MVSGALLVGLLIVGLLGFIVSMCLVLYAFWKRPVKEAPLPDGQYYVHFIGHNERTGAPIYDMVQKSEGSGESKS